MPSKEKQKTTFEMLESFSASHHAKNAYRILTLPLGQIMMAVGVFPGQLISAIMKPLRSTPGIKHLAVKVAKKLGVGRTAYQILAQDFLKSDQVFDFPVPAKPQDTTGLVFTENSYRHLPYTSKFGFPRSLETFSFEHENFKNIPEGERYYRIHAPGNSGNCGRFFSELAQLCQARPEIKAITYNHPGFEKSSGFTLSQDDLVNALCTQVKDLIDHGVKPEYIELTGFSIGAATAAIAAKKLKDQGIKVNLFCAQTFGTLSTVVTNNIPLVGTALRYLKVIPLLKWLALGIQKTIEWLFIKPLLWLSNWNMEPADAYKDIDADRKALTFVKPETRGKSIWKLIAKSMGELTGFFKRKNIDKVIPAHVSLASEVNLGGDDKADYKMGLQELYQPRFRETTLESVYNQSDNAITRNALRRLFKKREDVNSDTASSTQLINLAVLGWKGRRMQGTKGRDAHNTLAHDIQMREIKNKKWMGPNQHDFNTLAQSALGASGGEYEVTDKLSSLTYYTLFHDAIKQHNKSLVAVVPAEVKSSELNSLSS